MKLEKNGCNNAANDNKQRANESAQVTAQALWTMFDAMYEKYVPNDVKMC